MYHKAYGIIETLAPLHVGASAGEETGNLNLIFRDQFTQTGIIPGSSIRGRFRADMHMNREEWLEKQLEAVNELPEVEEKPLSYFESLEKAWFTHQLQQHNVSLPENYTGMSPSDQLKELRNIVSLFNRKNPSTNQIKVDPVVDENYWYGHHAVTGREDGGTTEALVKFEYASLLWLPVFCPGQPVVWVSCPRLLQRYKLVTGMPTDTPVPAPYTVDPGLTPRSEEQKQKVLFFNLGFLTVKPTADFTNWIPPGTGLKKENLVVVGDNDIAMIHDMALYRQSRVKLADEQKKVEGGAFFNVEALPEGSVMVFPVALKQPGWKPFGEGQTTEELYFGGLESIGFGHCTVTLGGEY